MTDKTKVAGVEVSEKEIKDAQKDGALEAIKDGAQKAAVTDSGTPGDPETSAQAERFRVSPSLNTTFIAALLDLSSDELKRRLKDDKAADFIEFENAKGLLALERAGKNRTDYVRVLCDAIGVKSPTEVTTAGPAYTNDVSSISEL